MGNYIIPISLDKRIVPFVKKGSSLSLNIKDVSSADYAYISIQLKDGVGSDMLEAISPLNLSISFTDVQQVDDKEDSVERRPALPHVEDEYDEVRQKVSDKLGEPVQALFTGNKTEKRQHRNVDPEPQTVKKESRELSQIEMLQKQMAQLMNQLNNLKTGSSNNVESEFEEPEQAQTEVKIESIMSYDEFKDCLEKSAARLPDIDLNKRMTRQEAQELEKYKLGKSAYVISKVGQLFVDDVGISVKGRLASNLASIPLIKLARSNDIHRCFANGQLQFVSAETARRMAEEIDGGVNDDGGKLKAYMTDGSNQVARDSRKFNQIAVDLTGDGDSDSSDGEDIADRMIRNSSRSDIMIAEVDEVDETNVNDGDDQSDLMGLLNLSGGGDYPEQSRGRRGFDEPTSQAAIESARTRQLAKSGSISKTWKPTRRLDE